MSRRRNAGENLISIRESRMWTQIRLAREAGVSPTTVSGIESGRIERPHFGTLRKLARALGVRPEDLLAPRDGTERAPLSLEWALSSGEEEFERGLEHAPLEGLRALSRALAQEMERLRKLYETLPEESEQRRVLKARIRRVAADSGSVEASILAHPENRRTP
ncbi:helix-turn-helix transcriptional regulator [Rubrobacter xylanophilus]|uniref:helix-turn-helix transcriptional regulator n=1 Tax=Rubrobacter xylanophilus TaxID=49319 RepID=UPI00117B7A7A|nr:helix-turn-helix transcriptional regulator [Rubrobacter xylanophilus]